MVHLNKNALSTKQLDNLFLQLVRAISQQDKKTTESFLAELLGKEERIMIAKRLAVVVLISEGMSKYKIGKILKLSKSTVNTIEMKLQKGHFDTALTVLGKSEKNYFAFLETLDAILHLGGTLPHRNGLDRYKSLYH